MFNFPRISSQHYLYTTPQVKVQRMKVCFFTLTLSLFGFCAKHKEEKHKEEKCGVTTLMWLHLNLPQAMREETVWHDCK